MLKKLIIQTDQRSLVHVVDLEILWRFEKCFKLLSHIYSNKGKIKENWFFFKIIVSYKDFGSCQNWNELGIERSRRIDFEALELHLNEQTNRSVNYKYDCVKPFTTMIPISDIQTEEEWRCYAFTFYWVYAYTLSISIKRLKRRT